SPRRGNGKARPGALECSQNRLTPTIEQGEAFRPAGGDICERDRVQATTLQSSPTMGDQVHLQETRFGLVPLGVGADRNLLFEQRTRLCGRKAMRMRITMGLQEAICLC